MKLGYYIKDKCETLEDVEYISGTKNYNLTPDSNEYNLQWAAEECAEHEFYHVALITCSYCNGKRYMIDTQGNEHSCPICNETGKEKFLLTLEEFYSLLEIQKILNEANSEDKSND